MSFLIIAFAQDTETDLILLIKDRVNKYEYWCITNGSEPITWLDTKNPDEYGKYLVDDAKLKLKYQKLLLGDVHHSTFYVRRNMKFDNPININAVGLEVWEVKGWKLQSNSYSYEMGLVLDERWEGRCCSMSHRMITNNESIVLTFKVLRQ